LVDLFLFGNVLYFGRILILHFVQRLSSFSSLDTSVSYTYKPLFCSPHQLLIRAASALSQQLHSKGKPICKHNTNLPDTIQCSALTNVYNLKKSRVKTETLAKSACFYSITKHKYTTFYFHIYKCHAI